MKIIVDQIEINIDDISDVRCCIPADYQIDMKPFIVVELKSGERIFSTNEVKIVED